MKKAYANYMLSVMGLGLLTSCQPNPDLPSELQPASVTSSPPPQLSNSSFSENMATSPGGGAYITTTNSTLDHVTFDRNSSQSTSGGLFLSSTNTTLSNLIFNQNTSTAPGGGLFLEVSNNTLLKNSVFANNSSANFGGGIYKTGAGALQLQHASFSDNSSTSGDAIYNANGDLTLRNSILWDAQAAPIFMSVGTLTSFYSLLKDLGTYTLQPGSSDNLDADPLFSNATDPEGADNIPGTGDDGLSLGNNSPAINIDTSNNAVVLLDIRKKTRDTQPDAGAYEK